MVCLPSLFALRCLLVELDLLAAVYVSISVSGLLSRCRSRLTVVLAVCSALVLGRYRLRRLAPGLLACAATQSEQAWCNRVEEREEPKIVVGCLSSRNHANLLENG